MIKEFRFQIFVMLSLYNQGVPVSDIRFVKPIQSRTSGFRYSLYLANMIKVSDIHELNISTQDALAGLNTLIIQN